MSSFELLQERLAALQETTAQLRELIDRLANVQFQPGSVPLSTSDEDNVATELSTEITQILREEEEDLELLQEEIIDLRSGRPGSEAEHRKARLKDGAQRLQAELRDCRSSFRKAQLSARRSLEAAQKLERDLLLASYITASASASSSAILSNPDSSSSPPDSQPQPGATTPTPQPQPPPPLSSEEARNQLLTPRGRRRQQQQQLGKKYRGGTGTGAGDDEADAAVAASSDITQALQRTHALIAGELAKSAFAARTLAESTAALAELQRSYEGLDGLLARSRDLLGALLSSQKSDTWYLQAALRLLLATLAWLLFRRFLYGPLWWLVWLPLRTGWRLTSKGVAYLGADGGGGDGSSSSSSATMAVVVPGEGGEQGGRPKTVVVGVGEEGAVPTVRVGRGETSEEGKQGEEDGSMVDKVGRMVEDTLNRRDEEEKEEEKEEEAANRTAREDPEDRPNPKKRMWEEDVGEGAGRVRDEL
ncbi:hypothetical protein MYCTH_2295038 [Thermothelomyces thermophilus ATCC 42464]|uniref:Sec20 C-terminal domain-containing protein n=1 Tax=Thermothelomyces thermophilus (strain ATCC 42464 / BCRC 31852 / DSM 1799) TaxID=573729 RepID=G2Q3J2_THET4|nr:uncharacterized protein MYCTH_2295038 [Thermothelomyces thermophilus ATCC 42464]AEO53548.1 hypothetical protein MYCTH_2295038 [Thermothelomyces thermophilus ATCC 42464]